VVTAFLFGLLLHERKGDFVAMPAILLSSRWQPLLLPDRAFFDRR
jgi:hypothetical protein